MIQHVVLMALNEELDTESEQAMKSLADAIRAEVKEVREYELVSNSAPGVQLYNWAILSTFESAEDLAAYKVAPQHIEFVEFTDPFTTDFTTLDYELAPHDPSSNE